jgi:hypothetical protein
MIFRRLLRLPLRIAVVGAIPDGRRLLVKEFGKNALAGSVNRLCWQANQIISLGED